MFNKIAYKIVSLTHIGSVKFVFFIQNLFNVTHDYQPNPFVYNSSNDRKNRNSFDRYDAIFNNLPSIPTNLIDFGCSRGFFVLQAAKQGIFSMGVDHDRFEILYARSISEIYNVNNALFMHGEINEELIGTFPKFEMTICTSIFHHWVRVYGKEIAFRMMQEIADNTTKYLVFETGQNNETDTRFYPYLEFMGSDYEDWIVSFLSDLGFSEIKKIGDYGSRVSNVNRTLFLAIK
jgi:hypothetical protein